MSPVLVRPATPDDSRCIASVHVRSWNESYIGRVPEGLSDLLDVELSAWRWATRLRGEKPPDAERLGDAWVALRNDRVVGFSSAGPARDADLTESVVELYALYVLAAHHGTGVGAALLQAALGPGSASLWVLADNPRARAFYAKHGFAPDGAARVDDRWGGPLREVRLTR
ncbi:GNAT family N-acetyltransferase [Microbacterium sp. VKM Ac-2923]|uniref:GNAT family N-acetyltransferase n=1 Tax=Microbacterium sp. VKM Ac-2923 TaxID=2929476 RepID=UPI001FB1CDB9|nr:GNAT family N-acetyltransferase [Microbacterium sp. VKM Ac-2923]MCJ1706303.1 GNAT family N-acetyltransferase [Microbacterium sp. VKM Ac-2923]